MSGTIELLPVGLGLPLSLKEGGEEKLSSFKLVFNKLKFVGFCTLYDPSKKTQLDEYIWMSLSVDDLLSFNSIVGSIYFKSGGKTYKTVPVNKEVFDVVDTMFTLAKSRPGS